MRWRFQEALNGALTRFLHGAHLHPVLFPLVRAPRRGADADLERVRVAARACGIRLDPGRPERVLAAAFRGLADLPPPGGAPRTVAVRPWDDAGHGRVARLRAARAGLRRSCLPILLHGSYATLDFTGYSDLDTVVVLPAAAAVSPAGLLEARAALLATLRVLKEFDPLQHHGHFVLAEQDLSGYPDPIFPGVLWDRCTSLEADPAPVRVRCVPHPGMARQRFRAMARRFLATDLDRGLRSAYRLKSDLSVFMLLPALWLQAQGRETGKRESFAELFPRVSGDAADAWRRAAAIRDIWQYRDPPLHRLARRVWFNPLLPAALDAARAGPPPRAVEAVAKAGFFARAKAAAGELLRMDGEDAGERTGTRDAVA